MRQHILDILVSIKIQTKVNWFKAVINCNEIAWYNTSLKFSDVNYQHKQSSYSTQTVSGNK